MTRAPQAAPKRGALVGPALTWLATRIGILALAVVFEFRVASGDLEYYWQSASGSPFAPGTTMLEYPTPTIALLHGLTLLAHDAHSFAVLFMAVALVADLLFTAYLALREGGGTRIALGWTLLTFLCGPLLYMRFDVYTAILLGVALVEYRRRPALTGAAIALAVGLKVWPALTIVAFVGLGWPRFRRIVTGFALTGLVQVIACVGYAGIPRLLSPLMYQVSRGLNVDSVWATVPMLWRLRNFDLYPVAVSAFAAFEVTGPGVSIWLGVATASLAIGLLALLAATYAAWRRGAGDDVTITGLVVAATLLLIVSNKTLSPQYLVWLSASVPFLLEALRLRGRPVHAAWALAALIAVLTHLTYPLFAGMYTPGTPSLKLILAILTLATRNVLLLIASGWMLAALWRWTRGAGVRQSNGSSSPSGKRTS
ncbi:MAG: hypothetical protein IPM11_10200 [Micropruina sp.]|nr:hypothetical protein [Micropruina sp.]